jgi:hypothetical protein
VVSWVFLRRYSFRQSLSSSNTKLVKPLHRSILPTLWWFSFPPFYKGSIKNYQLAKRGTQRLLSMTSFTIKSSCASVVRMMGVSFWTVC